MDKKHNVEVKGLSGCILELVVDGCTHQVDLANESSTLANATQAQREDLVVSPSGYGIHWAQLDEDLAIDPLIGISHDLPVWKVAEERPQYTTKEKRI
jgi:hypothetical protein